MTFTITRRAAGRKRNGKCEKPSKKNRKGKPCTRTIKVGSFTGPGKAGANGLTFTGRLGGKKLPPRRYRLVLSAKDAAGNRAKAQVKSFTIVR